MPFKYNSLILASPKYNKRFVKYNSKYVPFYAKF